MYGFLEGISRVCSFVEARRGDRAGCCLAAGQRLRRPEWCERSNGDGRGERDRHHRRFVHGRAADRGGRELFREGAGCERVGGTSGTGGGFKKFCAGETDISNASRAIKDEEKAACEEAGIEFTEVIIANDGLSVVVNPENDWANCLTVDQLNKMWAPESEGTVTNWNQVDPSFPDQKLTLFGAGTDSGTFDYFTDAINGEEGATRTDYSPSEDDNVTVQGVRATWARSATSA